MERHLLVAAALAGAYHQHTPPSQVAGVVDLEADRLSDAQPGVERHQGQGSATTMPAALGPPARIAPSSPATAAPRGRAEMSGE